MLDLRDRSIQYNILQREVDTNRSLYDALLQRYKQIGVAGGIGESQAVRRRSRDPARRAVQPEAWRQPDHGPADRRRCSASSVILAIEYIDDTIKVPEDVETKLEGQRAGRDPEAEPRHDPDRGTVDLPVERYPRPISPPGPRCSSRRRRARLACCW